jgi:uncharacterized protein YjbI with pentapeptide repeats
MPPSTPSPAQPQLPPQMNPSEIAALDHDARVNEIALSDVALVDQHANGVTFGTVSLSRVDVSGSRLEHLRIVDGVLSGCNLANLHGRSAHMKRVSIASSRLTGIDLAQSALSDVTFRGCRIDLASFGFSHLERVTFDDCLLTQTDFLEAQLDAVRFHSCDLKHADFRGARLKRCELRGGDLTNLRGVESLRGAALDWPTIVEMAGVWAAALGIEVLDDAD